MFDQWPRTAKVVLGVGLATIAILLFAAGVGVGVGIGMLIGPDKEVMRECQDGDQRACVKLGLVPIPPPRGSTAQLPSPPPPGRAGVPLPPPGPARTD